MSGAGNYHDIGDPLESRIKHLETEIESIKKNAPSRLTKIGAVLGIFAAAVAVARGIADVYQWLSKNPQLTSLKGPYLILEYQPQKKLVTFQFDFSLANYGQIANFVSDADGQLSIPSGSSSPPLLFSSVDFNCVSGGAKFPIPFPLPPGLPAAVSCSVSEYVPEKAKSSFLSANEQHLTITFHGSKNTTAGFAYCFTLPDDAISEALRESSGTIQRRFIHAECE